MTASGETLAGALRDAAQRQGLTVPAEVVEHSPGVASRVPAAVAHRPALLVSAAGAQRWWSIRGEEPHQGLALIEGSSTDLAEVVRAADAWCAGEPLEAIAAVTPFVTLTGRFEVPDGDPAGLVESEWRHLLVEAATEGWPGYRALIDAAYAEPRLRALYPFTSHWTLRFSTSTRPRLSRDPLLCIRPPSRSGTEHVVMDGYMDVPELARTPDAAEAVAVAVRHLPADLPPVTYGGD